MDLFGCFNWNGFMLPKDLGNEFYSPNSNTSCSPVLLKCYENFFLRIFNEIYMPLWKRKEWAFPVSRIFELTFYRRKREIFFIANASEKISLKCCFHWVNQVVEIFFQISVLADRVRRSGNAIFAPSKTKEIITSNFTKIEVIFY